ncbi:MAG: PepSY domain-containing protein [Gammaproteobacteria bacterium]|nr:PepSY domain-containing protein [Gammaproteobacteria bacterium]
MRTILIFLILSGRALAVDAAPGRAVTTPNLDERTTVAATALSMDQAVKMVEQRFRARVVRAEAESATGHTVYVLRLLDDSGKVWTVRVDADNGSVQ